MTKTKINSDQFAKRLIQTYVCGWRENDIRKILKPLTDDCIIVESHGPTYHGKEQIKQWFDFWEQEKGKVLVWDIRSFYVIDTQYIAFFEWNFVCNVRGKEYRLPGISLVKFKENKICSIHEYRMTHEAYAWEAKELNPD